MAKKLTEDAVRDKARYILGFKDKDGVRSGVGQLTTFNQLGFAGVADKPDKGRHDVYNKWSAIEDKWVDIVMKQSGDDTCQWVNPEEHLSYQMPQKPFEIFEEDFRKTAMDYIMFQKGIDTKDFGEKLLNKAMYSSKVEADDKTVTISMEKGGTRSEKD